MRRNAFSQIGPVALVAGLLGSLAIAAPAYNAAHEAPRAVFLTLPETLPQPDLSFSIAQDYRGNWILQIDATAFQFTEICTSVAEAVPVGHAHVIVNGQKVGSAYSPIFDLGLLPAGRHHIAVTLRGQDHRALIGKDGLIVAEQMLTVT
ncbi:hypothetical protein [Cognatiyoonia sp. IB215182]|uniref:hypothetical protein n=1 Tax=Cognatiyoonia sp. IB215182 TaxID=3097353 RepID=UPI002A0B8C90|nr:hypothetical protein [Cognatiyoonia sp. IB215182]MDX8353174.1 hypothetical protein [Cognatiyoonia sp. IB215182]